MKKGIIFSKIFSPQALNSLSKEMHRERAEVPKTIHELSQYSRRSGSGAFMSEITNAKETRHKA